MRKDLVHAAIGRRQRHKQRRGVLGRGGGIRQVGREAGAERDVAAVHGIAGEA